MEILSQEIREQIPALHTQDSLPDEQLFAYARLTFQFNGQLFTWFVLELHTDQDLFSGYFIDPLSEQFGYFSFAYLEEALPVAVVNDPKFTPKLLIDAVKEERLLRQALGEHRQVDASIAQYRAYYYAVAYDQRATAVFDALETIVMNEPVNLSVFQLTRLLPYNWHIVIIGDRPAEPIHAQIMEVIKEGTLTTIPYELLMELFARKLLENFKGEWRGFHRNIRLHRRPESP